MFNVKYATTFSEGFYRAEEVVREAMTACKGGQGSADSEVLNCRYLALSQACAFHSSFLASMSDMAIYRQLGR